MGTTHSGESRKGFDPSATVDAMWEAFEQVRSGIKKEVGTRMGRGDVRSAILVLLAEQPRHGYQLIREIEERTDGRWKPSAGSVYPTLQMLADEGLVTVATDEDRKIYSLTAEGKEAADVASAPWQDTPAGESRPYGPLAKAGFDLAQAAAEAARSGSSAQQEQVVEVLTTARRRIYSILAQD